MSITVKTRFQWLPAAVVLLCATLALASDHPVPLDKNVDAAKCLECHDEKAKGKHVHSAIAMGCTACHEVKTEKETTTVNFTSPKEQLCVTCHEASKDEVKHGPYEKGNCVVCHDPHVSDNEKQLRAAGNALCMECHAERRTTSDTVKLFNTREMPDKEFQEIPKAFASPVAKADHPFQGHPIADVADPVHPGEKITCLTCHTPHSSTQARLIKPEKNKEGLDVCDTCHKARDEAAFAAAQKRLDEQQQQAPPAPQPGASPKAQPPTSPKPGAK